MSTTAKRYNYNLWIQLKCVTAKQ